MLEQNKELVLRFLDATGRNDAETVAACVDPDGVSVAKGASKFTGPRRFGTNIAETIEAFKKIIPTGLRYRICSVTAEGDRVVARGRLGGTHRGPFLGAPPTGRAFSIGWIAVYRVEGGKIAERWLQGDDLGMMLQLGLMKPPGAP